MDKKSYSIREAIQDLKRTSKEKFDSTIELHLNLDIDPKKQDQMIRFTLSLPNGTGKNLRVATFTESKITTSDLQITESDLSKIEKGEIRPGRDFDVMVSEPKMMSKLAKVAKILGPAGVMPNPKSGTVSEDPEKAVAQIKKGKIELKTEQLSPIIHTIIGKLSFTEDQLVGNFEEVMKALKQNKPQKVSPDFIKGAFICSTMGKSYKLII